MRMKSSRPHGPRPGMQVLAGIQFALLLMSFQVTRLLSRRPRRVVIIGPEENAGILFRMTQAVPGAVSVKTNHNVFYSHNRYDHDLSRMASIVRLIASPILLGKLTPSAVAAIYVGGSGYLLSGDGREREFRFLRKRGVRIICQFTGSDIRSHKLLADLSDELDRDVITTYQDMVSSASGSEAAEAKRQALASAADRHAHVIFNPAVDQISYIKRPTEPFLHFYPDTDIAEIPEKWIDVSRPRVLHAPSSPLLKGTPLVRAAVKALKEEGYDFEYTELRGQSNLSVQDQLRRTHLVLNQFYAFVPGVLGIEAMAANAVLLNSADPHIEPTLGDGADEAWIVTPYWRLQENLRWALDNPSSWQAQADRGTKWVRDHCSASACAATISAVLPQEADLAASLRLSRPG